MWGLEKGLWELSGSQVLTAWKIPCEVFSPQLQGPEFREHADDQEMDPPDPAERKTGHLAINPVRSVLGFWLQIKKSWNVTVLYCLSHQICGYCNKESEYNFQFCYGIFQVSLLFQSGENSLCPQIWEHSMVYFMPWISGLLSSMFLCSLLLLMALQKFLPHSSRILIMTLFEKDLFSDGVYDTFSGYPLNFAFEKWSGSESCSVMSGSLSPWSRLEYWNG